MDQKQKAHTDDALAQKTKSPAGVTHVIPGGALANLALKKGELVCTLMSYCCAQCVWSEPLLLALIPIGSAK